MAELVMRCNDLQCREELFDKAVVTTCSHIFCMRCAKEGGLFRQNRDERSCPACGTELMKGDDCVATALNPSEDYKSSVLSGLSPSVIMDCAARALSFYSYQAMNAVMYQEHLANSLAAKYNHLSHEQESKLQDVNNELNQTLETAHGYRKSYGNLENKFHELSEAFKEKSRALAETQAKYQQLKTQAMMADVQLAASDAAENVLKGPDKFIANTRSGYTHRKTTSSLGGSFTRPGLGRISSANNQSNQTRMARRTHAMTPSQSRAAPSRLSSRSSNERLSLDQNMRFGIGHSAQKTRLPMPIGGSREAQSLHNLHSRSGGYGFDNPNHSQLRSTNIALSGPSKRSRNNAMRSNSFI